MAGAAAGGWAGSRLRFECASGTGVRRARPVNFGFESGGSKVTLYQPNILIGIKSGSSDTRTN